MPFHTLANIAQGAHQFEMDCALEDMDRLLSTLYPNGIIHMQPTLLP